jgi:2-polyprenyl-3-methyl-5-hydroxy-6-metoxy-1,4-benzoquinol methylase
MNRQSIKSSAQKALRILRLEKPALIVLNKVISRYEYPYLKNVNSRGETLLNIIKLYLEPGDNFLDIMCGYSPLAEPLLESGYHITGFDNNRKAIKDLKQIYPKGKWIHSSSFEKLNLQSDSDRPFSVILLLGAFEICSQISFISLMDKLLNANKPRLFFIETNRNYIKVPTLASPFVDELETIRSPHYKGYNAILKLLFDHNYEILDVGQYDAQFEEEWATIRIYALLRLKKT